MEPSLSSIVAVVLQLAAIMALGVAYLRRARVDRPPVGVFNHIDVFLVGGVLVTAPVVYLHLSTVVLGVVFAVVSVGMLHFALAPLMRPGRAVAIAVVLVGVDIALAEVARGSSPWLFNGVNNIALGIMLVGMSNMWVQSGVRARHVARLGLAVAVYDLVATLGLPVMEDLIDRLSSLPLTPMLVWGEGDAAVGAGLGDLLMILLWTLVAEKAFSRRAGLQAATLGICCSLALLIAFWVDAVNRPLPAMVLLGPAMAVHYRRLRRKAGRERTMAEYDYVLHAAGGASPATSDGTSSPALVGAPAS
jgi:hypothetical protein